MRTHTTDRPAVIRRVDLSGQQFGRWTVLSFADTESHSGGARWLCRCTCDSERVVQAVTLKNGRSRSCGCIQREHHDWTPEKDRASKRKWRQSQPDYRAKESKRWRAKDPERTARYHRQTYYRMNYGMELEEIEALWESQGRACAICREETILGGRGNAKLDHDHTTNKVRGILCSRCNTALGHFRDDTAILAAALAYITKGRE